MKKEEKKYDFSDFDEQPTEPEVIDSDSSTQIDKPQSISQYDFSDFNEKPQEEQESSTPLSHEVAQRTGTAAKIYVGQKAAEYVGDKVAPIADKAYNKVLAGVGELTEKDIEKIRKKPDLYRNVRGSGEIAQDIADLGTNIRDKGFTSHEKALDSLKQQQTKVDKNVFFSQLADQADKLAQEIDTTVSGSPVTKSNVPPELIAINPSLANKYIADPGLAKTIKQEVQRLAPVVSPEGAMLSQKLEEIRSAINFAEEGGGPKAKLLKEYQRLVSEQIKLQNPEYAQEQKLSQDAIIDEGRMKKLGFKYDKNTDTFVPPSGEKLENILKKADVDPHKYNELQSILSKYGMNETIDEIDLSRINDIVKNKGVSFKKANTTKASVGGWFAEKVMGIPRAIGTALLIGQQTVGTKVQELGALVGSTMPAKMAKATAKGLWKTAPILGAGMTYAQASEAGLSAPEAALATGIGEVIPFSEELVIPALKQGLITGKLGDPEALAERDKNQARIIAEKREQGQTLTEEEQELLKKPSYGEFIEGKIRDIQDPGSYRGLQRMESMLEELNRLKSGKESPGLENMSKEVEQFLATDDRNEKAAIQYNLEQQPAFRKLLKKKT